jgi:hypothetical protein
MGECTGVDSFLLKLCLFCSYFHDLAYPGVFIFSNLEKAHFIWEFPGVLLGASSVKLTSLDAFQLVLA